MARVELEAISKRFGATPAISGMSLDVEDGEFVVLLGPTGAGKTTTLRLVAGLETPDAGRIRIGGADVTATPIAGRDVAFVFQQYSLYPHYTVFENLAFPLRSPLRRLPDAKVRAKVGAVAELLRIADKLENRATQLSGGEMQRVAIGRALVREPNVFLMDEPLSSLDAKLREDLRVELKRIQIDTGATILYVTHDQIEAMTMADRIGVLAAGELVQVGDPRNVYASPETVYVAQRLGSPPINLMPAGALGATSPHGCAHVGVRPEDVVLGRRGTLGDVVQVEHLGAETVVVLSVDGHQIHALAEPTANLAPGQKIGVSTVPDAAMHFDADGRRLSE